MKKEDKSPKVKKVKPTRKLNHAPLVEVVFELRWDLLQKPNSSENDPFSFYDPGFGLLDYKFSKEISKKGYKIKRPMSEIVGSNFISFPRMIDSRFFKIADSAFPIMQIGPGIFATNSEGTEYDWDAFKKQVLDGIQIIDDSYPKELCFKPNYLELRYVNFFDPAFLSDKKNTTLSLFINNETNGTLSIIGDDFSELVDNSPSGLMQLEYKIKNIKDTTLSIQIADAEKTGKKDASTKSVKLEIKIFTKYPDGIPMKKGGTLEEYVKTWSEQVREVVSPLFQQLLKKNLYDKLR